MRYIMALIIACAIAIPAYAADVVAPSQPRQGAVINVPMSGAQAETVAKAKELSDDAPVVLVGKIVSQVAGSKDEYMFQDSSGDIKVEIDRKVLMRVRGDITPDTTVRISGKMDKDLGKAPKVDVKMLEILN